MHKIVHSLAHAQTHTCTPSLSLYTQCWILLMTKRFPAAFVLCLWDGTIKANIPSLNDVSCLILTHHLSRSLIIYYCMWTQVAVKLLPSSIIFVKCLSVIIVHNTHLIYINTVYCYFKYNLLMQFIYICICVYIYIYICIYITSSGWRQWSSRSCQDKDVWQADTWHVWMASW